MPPGSIAIESSALSPDWIRELRRAVTHRGLRMAQAPVTGSRTQAEAGQLNFLVGADKEALAAGLLLDDPKALQHLPMIVQPDNDRELLLVDDRVEETGGDEVDHHRNLVLRTSDQIKEFQERGLVVEVLDARTGERKRAAQCVGRFNVPTIVLASSPQPGLVVGSPMARLKWCPFKAAHERRSST